MNISEEIKKILSEILDIKQENIKEETYLMRDLDAESIDLLEIAVEVSSKFNIEVDDDEIFLKKLRLYVSEAENKEDYLKEKYQALSNQRIKEIIKDLNLGPVLKVKDLVSYIDHKNIRKIV